MAEAAASEKAAESSALPDGEDTSSSSLIKAANPKLSIDTNGTAATTTTNATEKKSVDQTPNSTQSTPRRNPSSDSVKSAPLRSIEECLLRNKKKQQMINIDGTLLVDEKEANNFPEEDYFVPLNILRRVSSQGIEDDDEQNGSFRALAWRVLLGYLPPDRREWKDVAQKQRESYHIFVQELFTIDDRDIDGSELRGHHAKRKTNKTKGGTGEKGKRKKNKEKNQNEPTTRAPIKFVDGNDKQDNGVDESRGSHSESNLSAATSTDSDAPELSEEAEKSIEKLEEIIQEPTKWNLTDREQKILERLTNHQAINQLLIKRDCETWNNFLENATLLDEIRKDVNRTHPHLYFYLEPHHQLGARRYGALERILFVWAKLNKGVRYVQGMNELVGTLYYVLANDFNEAWADHAEADTYILFNIIMSEIRDIFVADMDAADTGIGGRIDNMQNLLGLHDPQVKGHLDAMGIDASFYAVRWLTTLLSREFLLPDTIRLWDSMFASTHKENFLRYVCVTMVLRIRDDLLKDDFAACLQLLQNYPSCSMDDLLDASRALWIYESQITMACVKGGLTLHQALQAIPPPDKVIMAFGLKGGIALTGREHLAEASAHAKEAVKNNVQKAKQGMQTLSSAGQGFLGDARRFIRGRIQRNRSDGPRGVGNGTDGEATPEPRRLVPLRNLSWGGRGVSSVSSASASDNGEGNDPSSVAPLSAASDAERL